MYIQMKSVAIACLVILAIPTASASTYILPVSPEYAQIKFNSDALIGSVAEGDAITAIGATATFNKSDNSLAIPVQRLALDTMGAPLTVDFDDPAGFKLSRPLNVSFSIFNLSFDVGTHTLMGDFVVGTGILTLLSAVNQPLLAANQFYSGYGPGPWDSIEAGLTASLTNEHQNWSLMARDFSLSSTFKDYMFNNYELDAEQTLGFLGNLIQEVRVTPVPESSTGLLMGLGLTLGAAMVAQRRRQTQYSDQKR